MAKYCDICRNKIALGTTIKAIDGIVCINCAKIYTGSYIAKNLPIKINEISKYYKINEERKKIFNETQRLKSLGSSIIHIDTDNRLFYINKEQIYYSFDEVIGYTQETIVESTTSKTKKKGGLTRAIVGGTIAGPLGAVIGANTAKSETISNTNVDIENFIEINAYSGYRKIYIYNPPNGLKETINIWIQQQKKNIKNTSLDNIEEIKKYKELLDNGIINKEEFDIKKKQLLNL